MASPKPAGGKRGATGANTPNGTKKKNPDAPPEGRILRVLKWALVGVLALAVLAAGALGIFWVSTPIPNPNKDFVTANTHLYFADGKTSLGMLSVQNREMIDYATIPQTMKDAMVAAENPTFWTDPGISPTGILRAVSSLGKAGGGSTLTQQYVKVLYLTQDKTLLRKLREMVIALKVGQDVPKEEILAGYLNTVYFGRGTYGVEAASKAFFGIPAAQLDLQQSIVLAALVNAPGLLDPANGKKQAADLLERYQYTINSLVKMGKLTEAQKAQIYTALPAFPPIKRDPRFGGTNGYLMQVVMKELKSLGFDDATINGGGLEVTTTFDAAKQDAAVSAAQTKVKEAAGKKDASQLHASVVSIDNATGGVLAMYAGNDDYVSSPFNWAITPRATGSTFKTWTLVAALRQGVSLDKQLKGYTFTAADGKPISGETSGMVSLQDATTNSINAAYVDLTTQLKNGASESIKAAQDAGIPGQSGQAGWDPNIRIAMGTAEVAPVDNASGYSTLANDGVHVAWHVVSQVKDRDGVVVYTANPQRTLAIDQTVATAATDCLTEVAKTGTGRVVGSLNWPVAGKTGTRYDSENKKTVSSWFVGYTKQITTAVNFVAGDSGNENLEVYSPGFYGGGYPAQTWLLYMQSAMKGLPVQQFTASNYAPTETPAVVPAATTTASATPTASVTPVETTAAPTPSSTTTTQAPPPVTPSTTQTTRTTQVQTPTPHPTTAAPAPTPTATP